MMLAKQALYVTKQNDGKHLGIQYNDALYILAMLNNANQNNI